MNLHFMLLSAKRTCEDMGPPDPTVPRILRPVLYGIQNSSRQLHIFGSILIVFGAERS